MNQPSVKSELAYEMLLSGTAPCGLHVRGELDFSAGRPLPVSLPEGLTVDFLNLTDAKIASLPAGLRVQELVLSRTPIRSLPNDMRVRTRLDLTGCDLLEELPTGLTVGTLNINGCTALRGLPEGLDVWFLNLSGCHAFEVWPCVARIRGGQLLLRGCAAVRSLPPYVNRLAALNVRECPNFRELPPNLVVTGWLDLAHSGLTDESLLPDGCRSTQLRWAGVNVDSRLAFHPELMTVDEIVTERNAERRRVLLDRYGYGRFLSDAQADVLDTDTDPGGQRQLLRVELKDDEPLVAMSCYCPSTGRQYMIRVPPATTTCHNAAAWIAGFDDPSQYRPVLET